MGRLTKREKDGAVKIAWDCPHGCQYVSCSLVDGMTCQHQCEADVMCKLADYEDAEELGLLLRLKVKPGDSLYKPNPITLKEIVEIKIESIFITEDRINISGRTTKMHYSYCCSPSDIGKTVFLTHEEAESALAEKGGAE